MSKRLDWRNWGAGHGFSQARRIVCIVSLIVWPVCPSLFAQNETKPDSILILRDEHRNPKFVFPYEIAVEYRNLKSELYPLACERIGTLTQLVATKESLVQNLEQQNRNLAQVVANQKIAVDTLSAALAKSRSEIDRLDRKAKLYKALSVVAMPAAVIAGAIALLK
jgi:uncharacterized coiled-coil protein SlyX